VALPATRRVLENARLLRRCAPLRNAEARSLKLKNHASRQSPAHTATPKPIKEWSLTTPKEKLIKIGAKVVGHAPYVSFQMAGVAIPRAFA